MSNEGSAPQIQTIVVGETRNVAVSFAAKLDSGELLTGTPTVVEVTSSDLTITNEVVSTGELTILGETVAIGQAVTFTVSGALASGGLTTPLSKAGLYQIKVTPLTNASNAQTFVLSTYLRGVP